MILLGQYQPKLSIFHYQELLQLLQDGLVLGDYGGGALFDQSAANALIQQGQDFSTLPTISASARAAADSVNTPLAILAARYAAIGKERDDFLARMDRFLAVLEQDSTAVDRLLYAAEMETWMALRPQLSGAARFGYDFTSTHGEVPNDVSTADPQTGFSYTDSFGTERQPIDVSFLVDGELVHGIGAPVVSIDRTAPISLSWTVPVVGNSSLPGASEIETLVGPDWTKYSVLAPAPVLMFHTPTVAVILPKSRTSDHLINVRGRQVAGNLPVYVKIVFVSRRRKVLLANCADQAAQSLSVYRVSPDDIIVYDGAQSYEQDQDYTIDLTNGRSNIVPRASLAGKTVHAQVTEYFPGYQCSINNMDWSPAVMFDAVTPFADVRKNYFPIAIADGWFPVVDELGSPLGIEIQPVSANNIYEALLRIEVVASSSFGVTGTLEIEFDRPGYYNGLRLSPFVNMPVSLTKIRAEGMLTLGATPPIFEGDVLVDRPVSIRFADSFGKPLYVRRLYLDFYQPSYDLKEHLVNPADQARQDALARLQTVLPFSDRSVQGAVPNSLVGAQYEFGLRDIAGERYNPAGPGVFVSGPFHVDGMPEIIRLDTETVGQVNCYLICRPQGIPVTTDRVVHQFHSKNEAFSFPDVWTAGALTGADFYLKWVLRSDDAVLTRFLLQVTKGA